MGWKLNVHWYPKRWPFLRVEVAERSMLPALRPGDWLLARRTRRIRPGQVVLAWYPGRPDFLLVKRAVRRVEGAGEAGGGWWLESDNPAAGAVDSNRFGPVPPELIVGRVLGRYRPLRRPRRSPDLSRTGAPDSSRARVSRKALRPHPGGRGLNACAGLGLVSAVAPRAAQCRGASGSSSGRAACRLTRFSISSLGSLVAIAQ